MTTGRINQITIVRRGWPPAPEAPERFPSYWWAPLGCAAHSAVGRAYSAAFGNPLSPSSFTRAPPATHNPLWAVRHGHPSRRTGSAASTIRRQLTRGYPLSLSGKTRHRPVTHRTHPAPTWEKPRWNQATPVRRAAVAADFVEVDACYEPIASEAGACKPVQKATQHASAR
jgi:hypothetical protein